MTIHLKAVDEATFNQALLDCGWSWEDEYEVKVDEEGNETVTDKLIREAGTSYYTQTYSLDIIGTIHAETGNTLSDEGPDGNTYEYPEMVAVEGYHANLLLHGEDLPASLEPFVIEAPSTPYRRFA